MDGLLEMRSRPYRSQNLFDIPVDENKRFTILPFGMRDGEFSFATPQFLLDAYESAKIPRNAVRDALSGQPISQQKMINDATRLGVDWGMLPALAVGAVTKPSSNILMSAGAKPSSDKISDPMVVMHNINEAPLQKAYEIGGIPVPSLAITKADEPLRGFGEVSLIGDPSMAKPSVKNPIYKTDAYTIRRPRTDVNPNKTAIDFVKENYTDPISIRYTDPRDVAEDLLRKNFNGYSEIPLKAAFLKEKGLLPDLNTFKDEYEFNQFVREKTREEYGYNNWFFKQAEKLKESGGFAEERIFLGYSPSGKRKYTSATLANLVKEMKGKGAGSEGMSGTPKSFRGKITQKFKTEKEVKESRGLLGKEENFEELFGEASESYYDIITNIQNRTGLEMRGAEDVLEYIIVGGDRELTNFAKPYADEFNDDIFENSKRLADIMRSLPTEYFEVKPQRGVSIAEFKGAIVPSNVEQSTLDALKGSGITNIKTYNTQEERAKLVKEFGDQFFTAPNVPVPITGLLSDEKENNSIEYYSKPAKNLEEYYRRGIL